jgi:NAD(P)-dependent dehydrogenase (short-subunit alcohol dehydrogenase family)
VRQRGGGGSVSHEGLPARRVRNDVLRYDSQGNGAADPRVARAVQLAQCAGPDTIENLIVRGFIVVSDNVTETSQLEGRVALVTGGSRGIGYAIAERLVAAGTKTVIVATSDTHLLDAVRSLRSSRDAAEVEGVRADVQSFEQVQRAVQHTVDTFGGLDILINNAGIGTFGEVADMPPDAWHRTIGTNLTGVFHCCHAAIPHLRRRGGGWIINVSSLAGKNPFVGGAAYCASKAGLNAFSEALMQEVRFQNIRVSYIMPGSVATDFRGTGEISGADWKLGADDVAQVVMDLLHHPARSLPSRIELRPSRPRK